jgi:hypothetical protein
LEASKRKFKYRIDRKMMVLAIALFAGMMYLTTYAHEIGHSLICQLSGYESKIVIQPYTFETRMALCSESPDNTLLYWSMGGIMGMAAAAIPLFVFRKHKLMLIAAMPFLLANALTGSMETFVNEWYRNNPDIAATITSVPMLIIFCVLLFMYSFTRVSKNAA